MTGIADITPLSADDLAVQLDELKPGPGGFGFLNGHSVTGFTFTSSADFSSRFIDNVVFERCRFEAAPLFEAHLSNVRFVDCDFVTCNLAKSRLSSSVFQQCRFSESRFEQTMFRDCAFTDTFFGDCVFFPKSWFSGTATRTTFQGLGEQPRHIGDLVSEDVVWDVQLVSPPPPLSSLEGDGSARRPDAAGVGQVVATLRLATVDDHDREPISDDPLGSIVHAYRQYERLDYPTDAVVRELTPYQRISLVALFAQLCELAINHRSLLHLRSAFMVYEIGAPKDDYRQNLISLGVYVHTQDRLAALGVVDTEPFPSATRFRRDLQKLFESVPREHVTLRRYGLQEVVVDGAIKFAAESKADFSPAKPQPPRENSLAMKVRANEVVPESLPEKVQRFYSPSQTLITPGKEYVVLAMSVYNEVWFVLIADDENMAEFVPLALFTQLTNDMPPEWICNVSPGDGLDLILGPEFLAKDSQAYSRIVDKEWDAIGELWKFYEELLKREK